MSVRTIALAIPLVLGIACQTSSTQATKDHTGAMWTERSSGSVSTKKAAMQTDRGSSGSQSTASSTSPPAGQPVSPSGPQEQGGMASSGASDTGSSASGPSGSPGSMGQSDTGSSGTAASPDQGQTGSSSGAPGAAGSADANGHAEGHAEGHGEDQVLRGKLSKVSDDSITISSSDGETTLKIVPETVVTMNGKTIQPSQIKQGLPVRASYAEQDGEHVAVKIDVGKGAGTARSKQHGGHPGGMQHGGQ